jgi:hypothetical protein
VQRAARDRQRAQRVDSAARDPEDVRRLAHQQHLGEAHELHHEKTADAETEPAHRGRGGFRRIAVGLFEREQSERRQHQAAQGNPAAKRLDQRPVRRHRHREGAEHRDGHPEPAQQAQEPGGLLQPAAQRFELPDPDRQQQDR